MTKPYYYIGLMSGTSADGIDLALVDFRGKLPKLVAKYYQAYSEQTHQQITALYLPANNEIERAFSLDVLLAKQFAQAINQFIQQQNLTASDIVAIGNHGQTIRHRPLLEKAPVNKSNSTAPFTLQISCNQTLATLTNIRVIGDFRRKDIVLGGQGAPLVPAFHQALFPHDQDDTFVVNIGGISNITFLPKTNSDKSIIGFDTGPGNALMDDWFQQHHQGRFDRDGAWAAQGKVNQALLNHFLDDNYFALPAPKSTGREIYHLDWLLTKIAGFDISAADVQATLAMFTAQTIVDDIHKISQQGKVFLCGGGVLNINLYKLIGQKLKGFTLADTNKINIDSDALEAMAFAWFAYAFDQKICGNIPAVTGASKATILGVCYTP